MVFSIFRAESMPKLIISKNKLNQKYLILSNLDQLFRMQALLQVLDISISLTFLLLQMLEHLFHLISFQMLIYQLLALILKTLFSWLVIPKVFFLLLPNLINNKQSTSSFLDIQLKLEERIWAQKAHNLLFLPVSDKFSYLFTLLYMQRCSYKKLKNTT